MSIILTQEEAERLMQEAIEQGDYYDEEELYHGCTVQVLRNSRTGAVSYGWWGGIKEMLM